MTISAFFFFNSILLGVGLAMDAFSVSMANGLNEPQMRRRKLLIIAGTYAVFQFLMPMIGWICVHAAVNYFTAFQKFIPWIALILLVIIGGNMLREAFSGDEEEAGAATLTGVTLLFQGIATSIDALSVGFTISDYNTAMAVLASVIIAVVTLFICIGGVNIGKKFGTLLAKKAAILGGVILIFIGIEIFVRGVFF